MSWQDDKYQRKLLDGREKWGTVLSITAVVGLLLFLADHPHSYFLNFSPIFVGLLGSLYVVAVNSYYKQAEAISKAKEIGNKEKADSIRAKSWYKFTHRIRFLGWFNSIVPLVLGILVFVALTWGGICPR